MTLDPANPVVQLCVKGIETEHSDGTQAADTFYRQAWQLAANPLERVIAAHYLARTQDDVREELRWNLEALEQAARAPEEQIASFYPSLYLNVAKSYEALDGPGKAREYYLLADRHAGQLPDDGYGNMIRKGIAAGLDRTAG